MKFERFDSFYDTVVKCNQQECTESGAGMRRMYLYIASLGILGRLWAKFLIYWYMGTEEKKAILTVFTMYHGLRSKQSEYS